MCHCCKTFRREDITCGLMEPRAFSITKVISKVLQFLSNYNYVPSSGGDLGVLERRMRPGGKRGSLRCRWKFPCKYNRNISWSSIVSKPRPYSLGKFFFILSPKPPLFFESMTQQYAICNFFSPYP